jgi:predicted kinase
VLVALGGLPGVGKSTIARAAAARLGATWLRIDSIEQAMRASGVLAGDVGPAGYMAAYAVAEANLRLGLTVIADCVNPVPESRAGWRAVAAAAGAPLLNVEVVCPDPAEHRRRAETRAAEVPGLVPPDWDAIHHRDYRPWDEPRLVLDTMVLDPMAAAALLCQEVSRARVDPPPAPREHAGPRTTAGPEHL